MKRIFIIIIIFFITSSVYAQNRPLQAQQVKYTRLDQIQKKTNPLFINKKAIIEFNLIGLKNLMNDSTVYGVEVNLSTKKKR